jgi:hypothetical protein
MTLGTTQFVSAHVLESDNGINGILHINPDDNPVVGKHIGIYLIFAQSDGAFSIGNYTIHVLVKSGSGVVQKYVVNPAYYGAADKGAAVVDFPKADVYDLVVTGTANNPSVRNFTLDYPVRVTGGAKTIAAKKSDPSIALITGSTLGVVLVVLAAGALRRSGRYTSKTSIKN